MPDLVTIHANQAQVISRPTTEEGVGPDAPSQAFLRVRRRDGATVLLEVEAAVGARTAQVTLAPDALDAGQYRGWMHLVFQDASSRDTSEFDLVVLEHAPGDQGVRTGRVYALAHKKIPVAWDALSKYPPYGDSGLLDVVQLVELRTFNHVLSISEEESLDLRVANYLAHLCAVEALEAAINYWTSRVVSQTARQSEESQTFPDRIRAHEDQLKRLRGMTDELRVEAELILQVPAGATREVAALYDGGTLTPGLDSLQRFYPETDPRVLNREPFDEGICGGPMT